MGNLSPVAYLLFCGTAFASLPLIVLGVVVNTYASDRWRAPLIYAAALASVALGESLAFALAR